MSMINNDHGGESDSVRRYPEGLPVPAGMIADTYSASFRIEVTVTVRETTRGVIVAHTTRFGQQMLAIEGDELVFTYDLSGENPHQAVVTNRPAPGRHVIRVDFTKDHAGEYIAVYGPMRIYVDEWQVAKQELRKPSPRERPIHLPPWQNESESKVNEERRWPPLIEGQIHSVDIALDDD